MSDVEKAVDRNFHHPFQPYEIQKQFMTTLYQCIEDGKIGIFESPTGEQASGAFSYGWLTWSAGTVSLSCSVLYYLACVAFGNSSFYCETRRAD